MYVLELDTLKYIYINRKVEDFLGYSPDEIINVGNDFIKNLIYPEDQQDPEVYRKKILGSKEGEIFTTKARVRHANGQCLKHRKSYLKEMKKIFLFR
jgi:PAS domain S-box-containing protein